MEWIIANEQLPPKGTKVLLYNQVTGEYQVGEAEQLKSISPMHNSPSGFTHWSALPPAPPEYIYRTNLEKFLIELKSKETGDKISVNTEIASPVYKSLAEKHARYLGCIVKTNVDNKLTDFTFLKD